MSRRVFISYSHDSVEHRETVLQLCERLREDGLDAVLDQYVNGTPEQGWPRWILDELDAADSVLVVCTETYYRRFRGHEEPGEGRGVDWEGALITQELYDARRRTVKFVPVFLGVAVEAWVPEPLRGLTSFPLTSEEEYERLYDALQGQAGVEARPVGVPRVRERRSGTAMRFDEARPTEAPRVDLARIVEYAPEVLVGREAETRLLNEAWEGAVRGEADRPRVLTFVALGGEGKTSLVARWAVDLTLREASGVETAFAWSFYSQGTRDRGEASSDAFLKAALLFFGDAEMAESARSGFDKGRRLAQLVGERRGVLILDGLEPLQYAPTSAMDGKLRDEGVSVLLKDLANRNAGLCVVTTRYSVPDLKGYRARTAPEYKLDRLSKGAGVDLLRRLGVKGLERELETLVEDVKGHALTLNLFGSYLREAHAGDVRKRDLVKLEDADEEEQGGHAFRVMDAYARWFGGDAKGRRAFGFLSLLGLFDRPATADCTSALLREPAIPGLTEALVGTTHAQRNVTVTRLEGAKLLTVNREHGEMVSLDAHPLLREYFARELREKHPQAWKEAQGRLFDYLCKSVEHRPDTLEGLQPLYQAISHGCHAERWEETCVDVFWDRVRREQEAYSVKKLGAYGSDLGAVACFFDSPWSQVSTALPASEQAWMLNNAAFCLRALGRSSEGREPMRAGLAIYVEREHWQHAARVATNLSELELSLGETKAAVETAERSVELAEKSEDGFMRITNRTGLGHALHQTGWTEEARDLFQEAERMQEERQPWCPLLSSLSGFRYCGLLLAEAEWAAWTTVLDPVFTPPVDLLSSCAEVEERARRTLGLVEAQQWLLDIAHDRLTLTRIFLYRCLLGGMEDPELEEVLESAVDGLRRAGQQDYLLSGLLTRAWHHALSHRHEEAKRDLDEAWEIAERGSMILHQIDVLLHRARLFYKQSPYPWEGTAQEDLREARRLIEKHGYGRRKEELEDAEAAIMP